MRRTSPLMVVLVAMALAEPAVAEPSLPDQHWVAHGDQVGEGYGWAVSELVDVTGDGAMDAIVSAPFHATESGDLAGHTDMLSGRTGELVYRFDGRVGDIHGWAVADAGDVDADGVHDVVVGAPQGFGPCDPLGVGPGRIYVYSGATGDEILARDGEQRDDRFGFAVATAGDVDDDGHADLLVGATCVDVGGTDAGRAYIVSGATGIVIRTVDGSPGDRLGSGADAVGDVNGDGRVDHGVGARDAHGGRGGVVVLSGAEGTVIHEFAGHGTNEEFGTFFVAGIGDVNRDGVPDVYVADYAAGKRDSGKAYVFSGRTGKRLHVFSGTQPADGLGPGRSGGDVDGDGAPDLVIGSYNSSAGAPSAGKVQVFSGANGKLLREFVSTQAGEQFGFDAVGLGDVDHDGRTDLLLSAASGDTVYLVSS